MDASSVQHTPIACVSQIAVSLQHDRHHLQCLVVITGSERAETLILMLLLDGGEWMFLVDELVVENRYLLLCVCVEGKSFD